MQVPTISLRSFFEARSPVSPASPASPVRECVFLGFVLVFEVQQAEAQCTTLEEAEPRRVSHSLTEQRLRVRKPQELGSNLQVLDLAGQLRKACEEVQHTEMAKEISP